MNEISQANSEDTDAICAVINDAAIAYKGQIPGDRWHEPYMPREELEEELGAGVRFSVYRSEGKIVGVMGIQDVKDVTLIRHAYVATSQRNQGIGKRLLRHLLTTTSRPVLIGTWKAAVWAIAFYKHEGFTEVSEPVKKRLLKTYWTVPDRQIETSTVLADARYLGRSAAD